MAIPDMNADTLASLIVDPDQTSKSFPKKLPQLERLLLHQYYKNCPRNATS